MEQAKEQLKTANGKLSKCYESLSSNAEEIKLMKDKL